MDDAELMPQGIYTIWGVNMGAFGMRVAPAGGLPANTFVADEVGNASRTIEVDTSYDMMVIAYHADHRTHGESPGRMETQTFEHLVGPWPAN